MASLLNRFTRSLGTFGLFASLLLSAQAQTWPTKPIRIIVPFAAGSAIDVSSRLIGQKLSEVLGQPVLVDNRAGAGGSLGGGLVSRAEPDGYTILAGSPGSMAGPVALSIKLPYDPQEDFVPVALVVKTPNFILSKPTLPAKNINELIALAKSKPGKLSFGSAGVGTSTHIAGELIKSLGNVFILHVPYRGTPAAIADLLAGQVDFIVGDASALPLVRDGRLRALAATTATRSKVTPDIPAVAESGLTGYDVTNWHGWFAPSGTPPAVVAKLNSAVVAVLADEEVRRKMLAASLEPAGGSPEYLRDYLREDIKRWKLVVERAHIKVE